MTFVKAIILIAILLNLSDFGRSCFCFVYHPQREFCEANFVIRAKVVDKRPIPDAQYKRQYKVKVNRYFKAEGSGFDTEDLKLFTSDIRMCGVDLTVGQEYLIMGKVHEIKNVRRPMISTCNLISEWRNVTRCVSRNLYRNMYDNACNCKVKHCGRLDKDCSQPAVEGCTLDVFADASLMDSVCKQPKFSRSCQWQRCWNYKG